MEAKKIVMNGACQYCGQMKAVEYTEDELLDRIRREDKVAEDIADDDVTHGCNCKAAQAAREREASLYACDQIIEEMFREQYAELADILQEAKSVVYGGKVIKKVTVTLPEEGGTGTISWGSEGLSVEFKKTLRTSASTGF